MSLIKQIIAEALEPCDRWDRHYGCCRNGMKLTDAGRELAEALSPLWREALENHQDRDGYYHGDRD